MIYWALVMAVTWTALQGRPTLANLAGGFVASLAILAFLRPFEGGGPAVRWRPVGFMRLLGAFAWELLLSNLLVAREALSRKPLLHRAILEVPLEPDTDLEIATIANLVTLTPGTLSLHVSRDHRSLFIHSLLASEEREASIRDGVKALERRVREAMR